MIPQAAMLAGAAGMSLWQMLEGMKQQKQAKGMFPQIPPYLRLLQAEYQRKSRNAEVGSMYSNTLNNARNIGANASQAVLQTGNPNAYNFAMRNTSQMMNDLLGKVQEKSMFYDDKAAGVGTKIADMQYGADANKYNTLMGQGVENQKFGMNNLMNLMTYNYGGTGSGAGNNNERVNDTASRVGYEYTGKAAQIPVTSQAPVPAFRGSQNFPFMQEMMGISPNAQEGVSAAMPPNVQYPTISSFLNTPVQQNLQPYPQGAVDNTQYPTISSYMDFGANTPSKPNFKGAVPYAVRNTPSANQGFSSYLKPR